MMDNEALVDQIVRSLSFEVVAMPQGVLQIDSTSKSTPLNVKIRVRKKHDAGLRHGVLSMPKVDTKSHSGKDDATQRVRLVSSDQTVMSFNVLMEAEFDKISDKQKLNIGPGVDINNDEDNRELSKNTNKYNFSPVSKRNKDIFGRCKPGGCLDPPFNEDKYSYQPTKQDLALPIKEDATKLRSSSIFKNKIFQRRKKSFQDVELNKTAPKTTTEDDFILSLYETGSNAAYSNSIITYPHPSNSGETIAVEEKPNRKRYSSEDKSRSSVSDDAGSYYILPKKNRNRSNQSDFKVAKLNDDIVHSDNNNIKRITTEIEYIEKKLLDKDEVKQTTNFVPIPLLVSLNAVSKDPFNTESTPQQKTEAPVVDTENKSDETVSVVPKINQLNCAINETDFSNNEKPNDAEKKSHLVFEDVDSQKTQDFGNNADDKIQSRFSTTTDNAESFIKKENSDYSLDLNHGDQMDIKSHPLVSTKERSILDITADFSSSGKITETANNVVEVSKNIDTVSFSTDDLAHLWKNKNEPLKSMPDFITNDTLTGINNEGGNQASLIEPQPLSLETLSYNTEFNQQDLELDNFLVQPTAEFLEDSMIQKEDKISDSTPVLESVTNILNLSDTHIIENVLSDTQITEVVNNNLLENLQLVNTDNRTDDNSPVFLNGNDLNENLTSEEKLNEKHEETKIFTDNNVANSLSTGTQLSDSEDSKLVHKKSSTVTQSSVIKQQENVYDDSNDNNNIIYYYDSNNILENASTKDKIIIKDRIELKNEQLTKEDKSEENKIATDIPNNRDDTYPSIDNLDNVSDNEKLEAATDTLNNRDDTNCSINNLDNVADNKKLEVIFNKNEITESKVLSNIVQLKQPPYIINENFGKPNFGQILSNTVLDHKIVPNDNDMLQKNGKLWKIDIGLQSYTDENNERVIKSFNSQNTPDRHLNDTILVAQCYLKSESNEIKIPIDDLNELSIQIGNNNALSSDLKQDYVIDDQSNKKKKIKLNVPNEKDIAKDKDANKPEANKLNKAISDDIRDALNKIYEQELLPLQEIIKGLREEIDMLVAYQNKYKEKLQKLAPKTSRPLKLVYPIKKCACIRKI